MTFAHWRKCDFQLHTPRDPNWQGARPIGVGDPDPATRQAADRAAVDAVRRQWAKEFIDRCVARGLKAVALTDHHEMVMIPYVQQDIADRVAADAAFDLWLFPGMELTAAGGKQCLILFDVDLPQEWWQQAQGKLGIAHAALDTGLSQGPPVTQLACSYPDIGKLLDEIEKLRGHYIVLPNVSEGGRHTVLNEGAHADFKKMPYVGGYLDAGQTINSYGRRNKARTSGQDENWSTRPIYPLPTSDSRSADFANLGTNNAWIKLADPTAEAVRQAFLGNKSRISIALPSTPALHVAKVSFDGSAILEPSELPLSPELNSIIGGRGSGKSSLLEYIAFGLGRSNYDVQRETYSGTQRLRELTNDTLVTKNGRVSLIIVQDNAEFRVTRSATNGYQPEITYPNGSSQIVTAKELRSLFPAVVYSQGELAEIGKQTGNKSRLSDLLQFVNPEYKREDDRIAESINSAKDGVRAAIRELTGFWALRAQLRKLKTERDSLRQRVEALEKTLPEQSDDDKTKIAFFDKANAFDSQRIQASKHSDQIEGELKALATELLNKRDIQADVGGEAKALAEAYDALYDAFSRGLSALKDEVESKRKELGEAEAVWQEKFKEARADRDGALEKLGEHRTVTAQIIKLREQITEMTNKIADLEAKLNGYSDPDKGLKEAITALEATCNERAERTQAWASEIEALSSGKIKANVDVGGDISELRDAIDLLASKTGSKEATRLRGLDEAIEANPIVEVRQRLRADCLMLLYWNLVGAASGEAEPDCETLFTILGDTDRIKTALKEIIDSSRVEAISSAVEKPAISLSYCDGSKEISFEKASEGQRAAALLFMLLEQPGGALIIDQPEGDLDNKIITDLTEKLHSAKQNRQLIFASHNANIVVNGSSELVGYLDIDGDGNRHFGCSGAIDLSAICDVITSTMEGGEQAFKDRQRKYGY